MVSELRSIARIRAVSLLVLLAACLMGGGSSRADSYSLLYLRPVAALALASILLATGRREMNVARVPLVLLALFAATMAIQLVPLPPETWSALPGRAALAQAAAAAGIAPAWRPVSLMPDLTVNSLVSLIPPLAALLAVPALTRREHDRVILILIAAALVSSVLGVAQLAAGPAGAPHLYNVPTRGTASGLFANRNHNAAFLAIGLLCLGRWASPRGTPSTGGRERRAAGRRLEIGPRLRLIIAGALGIVFFLTIVATGSRTGLVIALPVLVAAILGALPEDAFRSRRARIAAAALFLLLVCGAVALALSAGRGASFDRFAGFDPEAENRLENLPVLLVMLRVFWTVGIGYGAFDPAFRWFEPDRLLHPQYFNHAHSDWLELVLTGGVPAALVLAAFVTWVVVAARRAWRDRDDGRSYAGLGVGIVLILGAASVSDYPLRTPLMAVLLALGCSWAALRPADLRSDPAPGRSGGRGHRRLR